MIDGLERLKLRLRMLIALVHYFLFARRDRVLVRVV